MRSSRRRRFDDFTGASEPGSFQISFFVFDVAFPGRRILGLLARLGWLFFHHVQTDATCESWTCRSWTDRRICVEKSKFFDAVAPIVCSCCVRLLKDSNVNLKRFCKSIISSAFRPCVISRYSKQKKRQGFMESLASWLSRKRLA